MGSQLNKSEYVTAPYKKGNDTTPSNVLAFTLSTTARGDLMPTAFCGEFVTIKAIGADCYWYFSDQNTVLPDSSQAAADNGGADDQLGYRLRDGEVMSVAVPPIVPGATDAANKVYFCRDGSGTGVVWMYRSSQ